MDMAAFLDNYTLSRLTDFVSAMEPAPSSLARYFTSASIDTTFAVIEREKRGLHLVPDTKRGYHGPQKQPGRSRDGVIIEAAHLLTTDIVLPQDIQNERAVGDTGLTSVDMKVMQKQRAMRSDIEATLEWHRVGAIKGQVLDADGTTVLYDLFKEFGMAAPEAETITFPTSTTGATNELQDAFEDITDRMKLALGGHAHTGYAAIVGRKFWNKLVSNPMVREAYNAWTQRKSAFGTIAKDEPFSYGGIEWVRYYEVVGGTLLVKDDEAHLFPVGPDIFKHYFAPADYLDTLNTMGQPFYSRAEAGKMNKWLDLEVQSNPLTLCMFPESLVTLKAA